MERIDQEIKNLVDVLNDLPKCVATIPAENCVSGGEFRIGFTFRKRAPQKIIKETLLIITVAIRRFGGKVTITEIKKPDGDGTMWEIRGHDVSPIEVALGIMNVEAGVLEKEVDALVARRGW
jgi:hypothetical protein